MKSSLFLLLLSSVSFADLSTLTNFQADFNQTIVDEKQKKIIYYGDVKASRPSYALWNYTKPVHKTVYVLKNKVIMVEPDLEQAIIKTVDTKFDFFSLLENAKKIDENHYEATFQNKTYTINLHNNVVESIRYKDDFDNSVEIVFSNQKVNTDMDIQLFNPYIPKEFDIIRE